MEQIVDPEGPKTRLLILLPTALRFRLFWPFWLGIHGSAGGMQVFRFVQYWLMFQLTGSASALGYVGLANAVPAILGNLVGGVFADRAGRRRLIVVTQVINAGLVFLLATITVLGLVEVWHVLAIAVLVSAADGVGQPALHAFYPHLIAPRAIMSAVVLLRWPFVLARMVAPAVSGFIIAFAGTSVAFYIAGLGFLIMAGFVGRLPSLPIHRDQGGVLEGLSFLRKNSVFSFILVLSCVGSLFGMSYFLLMPVFATEILQGGLSSQILLLIVPGMGGLLISLSLAYWNSVQYQGAMVMFGAGLFGLFVGAFGLTSAVVGSMVLALVLMSIVGMFSTIYTAAIVSSIQLMVPDHMRGRILGFYSMTTGLEPLGGLLAGGLASLFTAPVSVGFGGLAVSSFVGGSALTSGTARKLGVLRTASE